MALFNLNFNIRDEAKDGTKQVRLIVTGFTGKSGKYYRPSVYTGLRAVDKNWDKAKQRYKRNQVQAQYYNGLLDTMEREAIEVITKVIAEHGNDKRNLKGEDVQVVLQAHFAKWNKTQPKIHHDRNIGFWTVFDRYQGKHVANKAEETQKKIRSFRELLTDLEKHLNRKISFDDFDLNFLDDFIAFSLAKDGRNHSDTTIQKNIKLLKAFLSWAYDRHYHTNEEYKIYTYEAKNPEGLSLGVEDLLLLEEYKPRTEYHEKARDLFLILLYTGQRFSDLQYLTDKAIIKSGDTHFWKFSQQKTGERLRVPLSSKCLDILRLYGYESNKGLETPALSNVKLNKYIKEVAKRAGLTRTESIRHSSVAGQVQEEQGEMWQFITTHTARRSFITLSLTQGMPPHLVMAITGHKKFETLQKYVRITERQLSDSMKSFWS